MPPAKLEPNRKPPVRIQFQFNCRLPAQPFAPPDFDDKFLFQQFGGEIRNRGGRQAGLLRDLCARNRRVAANHLDNNFAIINPRIF